LLFLLARVRVRVRVREDQAHFKNLNFSCFDVPLGSEVIVFFIKPIIANSSFVISGNEKRLKAIESVNESFCCMSFHEKRIDQEEVQSIEEHLFFKLNHATMVYRKVA
jgi:hypothetical protein